MLILFIFIIEKKNYKKTKRIYLKNPTCLVKSFKPNSLVKILINKEKIKKDK